MNAPAPIVTEKLSIFQLVTLVLSIVILGVLVVDTLTRLPKEVARLFQGLDLAICIVFLVDFCIRFRQAENKLAFMKWGWIDLLSSIPFVDAARWGRIVRILRIVRLLRGVRSLHRVTTLLLHNKMQSGVASVFLMSLLLIFFCSVAMLFCENHPEANIKTADDAVWWSVTTITTVGYGDKYPTTTEGRLLAMFLMLSGVGLFGTLSGLLASFFLGARRDADSDQQAVVHELRALRAELRNSTTEEKTSQTSWGHAPDDA
jgi:voltage-gated potassium channel